MNGLLYKGYTASLEVSVEDNCIYGKLEGISDTITFKAVDISSIEEEFRAAVDEYLEACKVVGNKPQKPCSGKILLRTSPDLHAAALVVAKEYGSLNKFGEAILLNAVSKRFPHLLQRAENKLVA